MVTEEEAVLRELQTNQYRGVATICAEARFNSKVSLTVERAQEVLRRLAEQDLVEAEPVYKVQWRRKA